MYFGSWDIDSYLTFSVITKGDDDIPADASADPDYRIYEDETGTAIATGTLAKLDDANTLGFYSERIQLTAAALFDIGKTYTIYISYAVAGDSRAEYHTFQVGAQVDIRQIEGVATSANNATLYLKSLNINNDAGVGVTITGSTKGMTVTGTANHGLEVSGGYNGIYAWSNGSDYHGLQCVGNGTGSGATFVSGTGATGDGITAYSNATAGNGCAFTGVGTGHGAHIVSGTGAAACALRLEAAGSGQSDGLYSTGLAAGYGAYMVGGATNGSYGIGATSAATNGGGAYMKGVGTGEGLGCYSGGGTNAYGAIFYGVGTGASHGFYCRGNAGGSGIVGLGGVTNGTYGMSLTSSATNGGGLLAQGIGTGDGLDCFSGTGVSAKGAYFYGLGTGDSAGFRCQGSAQGAGFQAISTTYYAMTAVTTAALYSGIYCAGATSGAGFRASGGNAGAGMLLEGGGGANGHGLHCVAGASSAAHGIFCQASQTSGTGSGMKFQAGAAGGFGWESVGSAAGGASVYIHASAGNSDGMLIAGSGSGNGLSCYNNAGANGAGAGFYCDGGSSGGSGIGFKCVKGSVSGKDIDADEIDAIKTKTDFLPSVIAGGNGGLFVAGTNAATTITGSLTTTFTGNLTGSVGSLATQAKADVNAEVVDVMRTDTLAELSVATPAATPTFATATMLSYMALRNKNTQSASKLTLFNDAGTAIANSAISSDGTTLTKAELSSGA